MLSELRTGLRRWVTRLRSSSSTRPTTPPHRPISPFERRSLRGLFLTATPNRTDGLPIGIDGIAYTITYRDLFERGVIVEPKLDELTIEGFNWEPDDLRDLADYLLGQANDVFVKTLVVTSRVEHVEILHRMLTEQLSDYQNHILTEDDIAFVHGSGSSSGAVRYRRFWTSSLAALAGS